MSDQWHADQRVTQSVLESIVGRDGRAVDPTVLYRVHANERTVFA